MPYQGPSIFVPMYAVDFSALATSGAKFSNGSNVIDGKTWTVENTANADTFQITNGSGLVIDPTATPSDITISTRTAPLISIKFGSLSSSLIALPPAPKIFVQVSFTHANLNADLEQGRLMYERFGGAGTSQITGWVSRAFATSARFQMCTLLNNALVVVADTANVNDDVMAYYVQAGGQQLGLFTGVTSGGALPDPSAMTRRGAVTMSAPLTLSGADDFALTLTALPVNTSNSFSFTFKKLAVFAVYPS